MNKVSGETAEAQIRAVLQPGSVFHFPHTGFATDRPHYFVVLNEQPLTDPLLVLVHATSKVGQARAHATYLDTLIELTPDDYPDFTESVSAIDCGFVTALTIHELAEKFAHGHLRFCRPMSEAVLQRLRTGIRGSPTVERKYKKMIGIVI
jgi:hypothetical protein